MTPLSPHTIAISPIGDFTPELLDRVRAEIERIYGFPTEVRFLLEDLEFAFHPNRNQYHSTPILEQLARKTPPDALKVLALVQVDLFIPILTHVYGEAQLGGKACMISTIRLTEGHRSLDTQEPYLSRIIKEAIHELGHTFKLRHCREHTCLMHYCRNEGDVDRKSDQLCRYCKVLLDDEVKRLQK
ncbi:MAG: archaemetzincin [Desulfobacterales bacterium]|nr:archaemetzincin family Zn-dependent metalloprotease [Deltaproteobacteria bacterium]